jgi:hypothetical protein
VEIEVRVNLNDLKRAFRRLLARLPDEFEAGADFVVLNASGKNLAMVAGATSEVLSATVRHPGQARVPYPVFCGIGRILRFYRGRTATVSFSEGLLRIARTEFRHPHISILTSCTELDIVGTKSAKLQNL